MRGLKLTCLADVLNTLNPSYYRKPRADPTVYSDPDAREQAKHVRHLSKYVFPLQYGLSNVFSYVSGTRDVQRQPDYIDREHEIKARLLLHLSVVGRCKTPKRLKDILPLLEKMIWRHGKCGYKPLRDKVCPSKVSIACPP
ncbi:hypothetical protein F5I97DRAFT_1811644 [Phlebopus sp. FC_14]|nr:hypothetical protein F5I97DRAFT_1811644 [Phlebopus sp. FC_14]